MSTDDDALSGCPEDVARQRRANLVARLYAALDQKMREVEERIARIARSGGKEEAQNAADSERDARTLTALARLFEKLSSLEENGRGKDAGNDPAQEQEGSHQIILETDADRIRRDITQRLTRMLEAEKD